ncbi:galectin-9-like isoform X1 [Ascaphus truei]|uniref:galectin-9-like isoform X1 n=1 Tax=Ascaphus truei TaxID=8439 RepID=UPI003F59E8B0
MSFGQTPIYNPPVPFTTSFHNGLCDGAMVIINGTVLPSGDRFSVNFQCGGSSNDDIALHFNPRFLDGGYVVCNSKERNSWGKEENKREMPFHKGQPFEIKILIKCNSYMVSVNGNHFMEFCHRIPLNRVNTMAVDGSVGLTCVNVQAQGAAFPSPQFPPGPGYDPAFPQPGFPSHQPGFPQPQPGFPSHQPGFPQPGFPSHHPGFPQPQPGFPSHQPGFPPQQFPPGSAYNPNQFAPAPMQSSNYVMPYQTPIYGGLFASKAIIVSGTVAANPKR